MRLSNLNISLYLSYFGKALKNTRPYLEAKSGHDDQCKTAK